MNKILSFLLTFMMIFQTNFALAKGKIQNEDVKSLTDIKSAVTTTGTLTSGSACVSSVGSLTGLSSGLFAYDSTTSANISSGVTITAIPGTCSAGQIQLSAVAAGSGTGDTLTFGGQSSQLINDTKIWVTGVVPNQQLSTAISTGVIGGSSGAKNYLTTYLGNTGNGNLETGTTTGFSLGNVSLTNGLPTGTPTFGSGASGNLSITNTSVTPVSGTYSLSYSSTAATTAGNFVATNAFTIDSSDQAKIISISAAYKVTVGSTNLNFSGSSSNSFGLAVYDVTNSAFIPVSQAFNLTGSPKGVASATFQSSSNGTSYRLLIYNASASAGAATILFDDFTVSPNGPLPTGFAGFDIKTFTTTGSWSTNTTYSGYYSRIGDRAFFDVQVAVTGAPTSANLTINLPAGIVIDSTKMNAATNNLIPNSTARIVAAGSGYTGYVNYQGSGTVGVVSLPGATSGNVYQPVTQAVPGTFASGDVVQITFDVPVVGWGSNVVQSSDASQKSIVAVMIDTSGASVGSGTQVPFATVLTDNTGSVSSGKFKAPVSGFYQVQATVYSNSSFQTFFGITKNGVLYSLVAGTGAAGGPATGTAVIPCVTGDLIAVVGLANTQVLASASNYNVFSVSLYASPAAIQNTESVNGRYYGGSATVTGSYSKITYTTKDFDTHSAYSGGTLTIPTSGKYTICEKVVMGDASGVHTVGISIYKNGTSVSENFTNAIASASTGDAEVCDTISTLAGDLITAQVQDSGTTPSVAANNTRNFISWARVGN